MNAVCTMTSHPDPEPRVAEKSTEALQEELEDLIEKKCKLEEAEKDGWLNADNRLREIEPEIEHHVEELKSRKAEVPDINDCSPKAKPKEKKETEKPPKVKSMAQFTSATAPLALAALTLYAQ